MKEPVDVIIPTLDNLDQLFSCIQSMYVCKNQYPVNFIIVNNGEAKLWDMLPPHVKEVTTVMSPGKNLGWTGALEAALKESHSKYVVFANDDIFIPQSSMYWLRNMVREMELYPNIGAIGPSSNVVMGVQNMFADLNYSEYLTSFLIGFCMLVRREALDKAGGIHHVTFGGDDLDLSIRMRQAGYCLIARRDIFVFHYGFQTGQRIFGGPDKPNGWNSQEMTDNTNMELIRKHGFLEWWKTIINRPDRMESHEPDSEGTLIRKYIKPGTVIELGCGANKTISDSIGVDIVPKGEEIPFVNRMSIADVTADATKRLPFEDGYADTVIARHLLEHCVDTVEVLEEWIRILKPGGRLILACPDENISDTVPMNPQHVHAFTKESLANLCGVLGLGLVTREEHFNHVSFICVMEK